MGFTVNFYTFNKKENSTVRPSGTPTSFECIIKRGSGLIQPRLELDIGLTEAPEWNYCYIPNFKRYYYISEWYMDNALWTASLTCDVLATYKSEIGNADLYALRSSGRWDGRIVDNLYPTKVIPIFDRQDMGDEYPYPWSYSNGHFVLGVVNGFTEFGAICYYMLTPDQFQEVMARLMEDQFIGARSNIERSIIDPLQYIKSCVYIPCYHSTRYYVDSSVWIGNWEIMFTDDVLVLANEYPYTSSIVANYEPPDHPQAATRGKFLNTAPYTIRTLCVPPFGIIELDTSSISDLDRLEVYVAVDEPTGLGILSVFASPHGSGDPLLLHRIEAQVGIPISISQITRDYIGGVTSILSSVTSIAALAATGGGAALLGAGTGAVSGIGNAIQALAPRAQTIGSGGSYAQLGIGQSYHGLYSEFYEIVDDDLAQNGRPLCQVIKPKDAAGYYLIQDGDVAIDGTREEASQIRAYLESGFYYE